MIKQTHTNIYHITSHHITAHNLHYMQYSAMTNTVHLLYFRQTNLDRCLEELKSRGYACRRFLLDASDYGLPQSRQRVYIACVSTNNETLSINPKECFDTMSKLLEAVKFEPLSADFRFETSDIFLFCEIEMGPLCLHIIVKI